VDEDHERLPPNPWLKAQFRMIERYDLPARPARRMSLFLDDSWSQFHIRLRQDRKRGFLGPRSRPSDFWVGPHLLLPEVSGEFGHRIAGLSRLHHCRKVFLSAPTFPREFRGHRLLRAFQSPCWAQLRSSRETLIAAISVRLRIKSLRSTNDRPYRHLANDDASWCPTHLIHAPNTPYSSRGPLDDLCCKLQANNRPLITTHPCPERPAHGLIARIPTKPWGPSDQSGTSIQFTSFHRTKRRRQPCRARQHAPTTLTR
jgi:hypothetical protein